MTRSLRDADADHDHDADHDADYQVDAGTASPAILVTADGTQYLRTPDSCFTGLPGWPYEPRYVEIDGLRQGYVDEGPADADPILLLHGQPSWSYVYRLMIPPLVAAGHRVVAMDHLGMGRSDKPIDPGYYSFDLHVERLRRFMADLDLARVTLFAQDWGSVIGLWRAASDLDAFHRIAIANGGLPPNPVAFELPEQDDPGIAQFDGMLRMIPPQQPPFFAEDGTPLLPGMDQLPGTEDGQLPGDAASALFAQWAGYAYHVEPFEPSVMLQALTFRPLGDDVLAAYDAPFPTRHHQAAPRRFPSLVNDLVGRTAAKRQALTRYDRPFLTVFGGNDPGLVGEGDDQPWLTASVPGAAGQPHHRYRDASHFVQEDQGEDVARRLDAFVRRSAT